jgi:hypothetical protein
MQKWRHERGVPPASRIEGQRLLCHTVTAVPAVVPMMTLIVSSRRVR